MIDDVRTASFNSQLLVGPLAGQSLLMGTSLDASEALCDSQEQRFERCRTNVVDHQDMYSQQKFGRNRHIPEGNDDCLDVRRVSSRKSSALMSSRTKLATAKLKRLLAEHKLKRLAEKHELQHAQREIAQKTAAFGAKA